MSDDRRVGSGKKDRRYDNSGVASPNREVTSDNCRVGSGNKAGWQGNSGASSPNRKGMWDYSRGILPLTGGGMRGEMAENPVGLQGMLCL